MAEELQLPETVTSMDPQPSSAADAAGTYPVSATVDLPTTATTNLPKRQRRPSVRLGEIGGDPSYDSHLRRPNKISRFNKDPSFAAKTSRTLPLTNLVNGGDPNFQDSVGNSDNYADFPNRKANTRKPTRRARSNWNKVESSTINNGDGAAEIQRENAYLQQNEKNADEFREFELEGSESSQLREQQEQSPVNSEGNMGLQFWDQQTRRKQCRAGISGSIGVPHNEVSSPEKQSEGVREWLAGLGLERYAAVFLIHEVDDEVLPMLTLEDLKDMGINAVGSRRKMYSAILKLSKGFL